MFKEEWAKRRPALANLSIWTLVSYARKFDSLKKQLIQDHNQGIVYFRFGFRIRISNSDFEFGFRIRILNKRI